MAQEGVGVPVRLPDGALGELRGLRTARAWGARGSLGLALWQVILVLLAVVIPLDFVVLAATSKGSLLAPPRPLPAHRWAWCADTAGVGRTNLELFDDKFLRCGPPAARLGWCWAEADGGGGGGARFVFTVLCLAVSAVSALLLDLNAPFSPNYRSPRLPLFTAHHHTRALLRWPCCTKGEAE